MDNAKFFAMVRSGLFSGKLTASQVEGMEALLAAFDKARWPLSHAAYGLATAKHETAATMQPIAEYGRGKGKKYGKPDPKTGKIYYGRGFVQLTWFFNYEKAEKELGFALTTNPDLAMRLDVAAAIMVRGMQEGWFTSRANKHYLNRTPPDYVGARKIINGTDKDTLIAGYAREFEAALIASGYGIAAPAEPAQPVPAAGVVYPPPEPVAPPVRHDGTFTAPPAERSWWSRIVTRLLSKEP